MELALAYSLRVSVTDNCQLRCSYCLPDGPQHLLAKLQHLHVEHYQIFASVLRHFAIDKIRFTGGEPLLRKDLPEIIRAFSDRIDVPLALTTNGLRFVAVKDALRDAGLSAITFHTDTLKDLRYEKLMGRGSVSQVLAAIDAAKNLDLIVKINVVVQKGVNDDELVDFLHYSRANHVEVRFIEQMNTGSARAHVAQTFLSGADILSRIASVTPVTQRRRVDPSAPAEQHYADELGVIFGLIASDTRPFCANCNRLRLNADGRVRTCLYEPAGKSIGLKENLSEDAIHRNLSSIISAKRSFHPSQNSSRVDFAMAQIGG